MRIKRDCEIGSHSTSKAASAFLLPESLASEENEGFEEMYFILASTTSVHLKHRLPRESVQVKKRAELETRTQTLSMWQVIFGSLLSNTPTTVDGVDTAHMEGASIVDKVLKQEAGVSFAVTPKKHKSPSPSLESPEDFEMTAKVIRDLPGSLSMDALISMMREDWNNLSANVDLAHSTATSARNLVNVRATELEDLVEKLELKVSLLKSIMGDRPISFGTNTSFGELEALQGKVSTHDLSLDGLQNWKARFLATLESDVVKLIDGRLNDVVFGSLEYHNKGIKPLFSLLSKISSGPAAPGDRLFIRLDAIEKQLKALSGMQALTAAGIFSGVTAGLSFTTPPSPLRVPVLPVPAAPTVPAPATGLSAPAPMHSGAVSRSEFEQLKSAFQVIQGQVDSQTVEVAGVQFRSPSKAEAWLIRMGADQQVRCFLDPISPLSMSDTVKADEEADAKIQESSTRVKDPSMQHTRYYGSFNLEVPRIFGKSANPDTTASD